MNIPTVGQKNPNQDPRIGILQPKVREASDSIIEKIKEADINVGDFNIYMDLLNKEVAKWFNEQINKKKISQVIDEEKKGGEKDV